MTMNESANLGSVPGSETVEPSTDINNPANWDFADSDDEDDQNNQETPADGIESETDEAAETADQETGENADTDEGQSTEGNAEQPEEAKLDETLVTVHGGEQVPIKELKLGYLRERDYRTKTQDLANRGRGLEEMSNRVAGTAQAIAQFLIDQLPQEPNTALAMRDPAEYTRQRAIYDAAAANVNRLLETASAPQQVAKQLTQEQHSVLLQEESAKLAQVFPQTADPAKREAFFQDAFATARELGYSDEDMQGVTDHRLFALAHYARLGMQAEKARSKAMEKVNNAPPPVVRGKAMGTNAQQAQKQKDAIARLNRSGSLQDAMKVDWE